MLWYLIKIASLNYRPSLADFSAQLQRFTKLSIRHLWKSRNYLPEGKINLVNFGITVSPHLVPNLGKKLFWKTRFSWDHEDFIWWFYEQPITSNPTDKWFISLTWLLNLPYKISQTKISNVFEYQPWVERLSNNLVLPNQFFSRFVKEMKEIRFYCHFPVKIKNENINYFTGWERRLTLNSDEHVQNSPFHFSFPHP